MSASETARDEFLERLDKSLQARALHKLSLGNYRGNDKTLKKVSVKPVAVKGETLFSFTYHHRTQDLIKNYPAVTSLQEIQRLLDNGFRAAYLQDGQGAVEMKISARGKASLHLVSRQVSDPSPAPHDREKKRRLDSTSPWLHLLGITDAQGHVLPSMAHKWKQINRFVEIITHAIERSGLPTTQALRVLDFGSGKGYLTFAISDTLKVSGHVAHVRGIELRENLVTLCNEAASECGHHTLSFISGDIRHTAPEPCDVVIALHACDTATDLAIHYGIQAGASVILCAPCCHKEIRPQLQSPSVLKPLLRYGIHAGAEAEMLTDTLRALLLERENYEVQIMEFVSLEHTDKNRMLVALRRNKAQSPAERQRIDKEIAALKEFYGVRRHTLEELLKPPQ